VVRSVNLEGYEVREDRVDFAKLLFEACDRLGARREDGSPNLRRLAEAIGRAPTTLINSLANKNGPEIATLQDLGAKAGISLQDSLVALRVLSSRDAVGDLTPARETMLDALNGLHEDQIRDLARLVFQLRASGSSTSDSGRVPSPTR